MFLLNLRRYFFFLIFLPGFLACRHVKVADPTPEFQEDEEVQEISLEQKIMFKVDSLLNEMTLEQKVGQCFMPTINGVSNPLTIKLLKRYISDNHVGGIILLEGDLASSVKLAEELKKSYIPVFVAIDAEWGLGMRLKDAPYFKKNWELGKKADETLMYDYGREIARECRLAGINMVLGPVVDVVSDSKGPIGTRSFGKDPVKVSELGIAYALGLESGGVISVAKHFPGHGSPSVDSHKSLPVVNRDLMMLDSIDLKPFKDYVESGLSGVMVGHLAVPAIDSTMFPAAVSEKIITGTLKDKLGFKGLVLTDAMNMGGARGFNSYDALNAGADIIVGPADPSKEIREVIDKINSSEMSLEDIEYKCKKILFYKYLIYNEPGFLSSEDVMKEIHEGSTGLSSIRAQ